MVHESDSESSDDEESLPEITATAIPPITTPAPITVVVSPSPPPTSSLPPLNE